jgi:hypothetical protein
MMQADEHQVASLQSLSAMEVPFVDYPAVVCQLLPTAWVMTLLA